MSHRYSHAPRPTSGPVSFKLEGQALTVESGRKVDVVQLGAVEQVRLTYEPRSLSRRVYQAKVRMRDGKTFKLSSLNYHSVIQVTSRGPEYGAFMRALLRAIAGANPQARLVAGRSAAVWGLTVLLTAACLVGVAFFAWRAFQADAQGAALGGVLLGLAGIWQLEPMVRLNRPRTFTAENPPRDLVP